MSIPTETRTLILAAVSACMVAGANLSLADATYEGIDGSKGHTCESCECSKNEVDECIVIWEEGFKTPCLKCETKNSDDSGQSPKPTAKFRASALRLEDLGKMVEPIFPEWIAPTTRSSERGSADGVGLGVLLPLTEHLTLDLGLGLGSGSVSRSFSIDDTPETTRFETGVRFWSGHFSTRIYLRPHRRFNPWLSAGVSGLVLEPEDGRLRRFLDGALIQSTRIPGDSLERSSKVGFATGAGFDFEISRRVALVVSASHGFETGMEASLGLSIVPGKVEPAEPPRDTHDPPPPIPAPGFLKLEADLHRGIAGTYKVNQYELDLRSQAIGGGVKSRISLNGEILTELEFLNSGRIVPSLDRTVVAEAAKTAVRLGNVAPNTGQRERLAAAYDQMAQDLFESTSHLGATHVLYSLLYHTSVLRTAIRMESASEPECPPGACTPFAEYLYGRALFRCQEDVAKQTPPQPGQEPDEDVTRQIPCNGRSGRAWGCCGNYAGSCLYCDSLCLLHDIACISCSFWWCGPMCNPDVLF